MSVSLDDFARLLAKCRDAIERGQHSPRGALRLEEISLRLRTVAAAQGLTNEQRASLRRDAAEAKRLVRLIRQRGRPPRERPRRPVPSFIFRGLRRFAPRRRRSTSSAARTSPASTEGEPPGPIGSLPCGLYRRGPNGRWHRAVPYAPHLRRIWGDGGNA